MRASGEVQQEERGKEGKMGANWKYGTGRRYKRDIWLDETDWCKNKSVAGGIDTKRDAIYNSPSEGDEPESS